MHKIKARGVIVLDGKVFLVREPKKLFYFLPGGTLEDGESIKECLQRELMEELGVKAIVGDIINMREFKNDSGELYLDFWFNIENPKDFINIDKSTTSHGFEFSDEGFYSLESLEEYDVKPKNIKEMLGNNNKIILI